MMNTRSLLRLSQVHLLCVLVPSLVAARVAVAQPAAASGPATTGAQSPSVQPASGTLPIAGTPNTTPATNEPVAPDAAVSDAGPNETSVEATAESPEDSPGDDEGENEADVSDPDVAPTEGVDEVSEIFEPPPPTRKDARRDARREARAKRRAERPPRRLPIRAGAGLVVGGTFPDAAPVLGFALRGGVQRARCAFMLEGGLVGAFGGTLKSGDVHSSRATVFYHGYLAPTVELGLDVLFVSLGLPLGIGMWSTAGNTVDEVGTVRSEARSTPGLIAFVGGVEARVGRHFTVRGRHHITVALGAKLLLAKQDEATTTVQLEGAIAGSHERTVGARFLPTLNVGYDFF